MAAADPCQGRRKLACGDPLPGLLGDGIARPAVNQRETLAILGKKPYKAAIEFERLAGDLHRRVDAAADLVRRQIDKDCRYFAKQRSQEQRRKLHPLGRRKLLIGLAWDSHQASRQRLAALGSV